MKESYTIACTEAGLSPEATAAIAQIYNNDSHRLQYHKKERRGSCMQHVSISELFDSDSNYYEEVIDPLINVEEDFIEQENLARLSSILKKLPAADRELLLAVYSGERNNRRELAEQRGISTRTLQRHVQALFSRVKKEFLADEPVDDSFAKAGDYHG